MSSPCLFYEIEINNGISSMGLLWGLSELIYAKHWGQRMVHRKNKILVIILFCNIVFIIINVFSLKNHLNHNRVLELKTTFQRTSKWKTKEIVLSAYFQGESLYNFKCWASSCETSKAYFFKCCPLLLWGATCLFKRLCPFHLNFVRWRLHFLFCFCFNF